MLAVLLAAARTVSHLVQDGHFAAGQLSWLWLAADKASPVAALPQALQRAGAAGDLETWRAGSAELRNPLQVREGLQVRWLREAQRRHDLLKVAACRPKLKLAGRNVQ